MNIEFFDASLVCKRLELRKGKILEYLQSSVDYENWAAVTEAATALRELEAELKVWNKFRRKGDLA